MTERIAQPLFHGQEVPNYCVSCGRPFKPHHPKEMFDDHILHYGCADIERCKQYNRQASGDHTATEFFFSPEDGLHTLIVAGEQAVHDFFHQEVQEQLDAEEIAQADAFDTAYPGEMTATEIVDRRKDWDKVVNDRVDHDLNKLMMDAAEATEEILGSRIEHSKLHLTVDEDGMNVRGPEMVMDEEQEKFSNTLDSLAKEGGIIRLFDTGANRDTDHGKLDFEGFFSPLVLECYAEYMHKNRHINDGSIRDSDNWQKGMPFSVYIKSGFRHFFDWWKEHRGHRSRDGMIVALCGLMFNTMGYLHEYLKGKRYEIEEEASRLHCRTSDCGGCRAEHSGCYGDGNQADGEWLQRDSSSS